MKITVTQEHIAKGVKGMCHECPISLAIADAFAGRVHASVHDPLVEIWYGEFAGLPDAYANLPGIGFDFIEDFDGGYSVEPVTFFMRFQSYEKRDWEEDNRHWT